MDRDERERREARLSELLEEAGKRLKLKPPDPEADQRFRKHSPAIADAIGIPDLEAEKKAANNGTKREETGEKNNPPDKPEKAGPGNPPKEHRFKEGNPGGPGRPKGSKSMRKIFRKRLFDDEDERAKVIAEVVYKLAAYGNMQAIKLLVANGNPRMKR